MLNINGTLIAIVINFIILVYILKYFLYGPILKILEERKSYVSQTLLEADAKLKSAEAFMDDGREAIDRANASAKNTIEEASAAAEKIKNEAMTKAKKDIEEHRDRAKEEIRQLMVEAKQSIVNEAAKLSVVIAEKIILKKIDKETQKEMTDDFIERMKV